MAYETIVRVLKHLFGCLSSTPESISFWNVVEAVEGSAPMFQCAEIRQNEILLLKWLRDQVNDKIPEAHARQLLSGSIILNDLKKL